MKESRPGTHLVLSGEVVTCFRRVYQDRRDA
jgi:hypothetical protein